LFAAGAYWVRPHAEPPAVIRSVILAPEQAIYRCQGDSAGPAVLSPDGKRLAFAASGRDGKATLWIRPLDSVGGQSLPATDGAMFPFWSPDGQSIGFFADGKLKKLDTASGVVTSIAEAPISRGGAWNRDDTIVFAPNLTSVLMRVQSSGGAVTPVTRFDEAQHELSHRWPSFLPDGKHFLYVSRDKGVFVGRLDKAEPPRRILEDSMNAIYRDGYILYARGNALMAQPFNVDRAGVTGPPVTLTQSMQSEPLSDRGCFTASETGLLAYHVAWGTYQLTWVDRSGNRVGTLGEPALLEGVEISPDGKRVAAVISDGVSTRSLWVYDVDRGIRTRLSSMRNSKYLGMAWSQDSERLAYGVQTEGSYAVIAKSVGESSREETLFRSNFELTILQWLGNRGMMLMLRDPKTDWDIAYVPPRSKNVQPAPVPVVQTEASESGGIVSPDGRWVVYQSNQSGGDLFDAYIAAFPTGGHRRQVSSSGVDQTAPRWSRTGREIFLTSRMKLFSAAVRPAGDSLEIETPRVLFEMGMDCNSFELTCFDVSPDGKRFLIHQPTGPPPPVEIFQHWTFGLKR
jgi:Tol biopolymer transport system component